MIAAALLAAALAGRHEFHEMHMGVEVRIVVHAEDAERCRTAVRGAFDRVRAWDDALSDWREGTPAWRLPRTAGESTCVDGRLAEALDAADRLARETEGGFDAGLGALTRLWREARRTGDRPSDEDIARARSCSGRDAWAWDRAARRFTALRDGVRMDFGAIGQGLAADDALAALREAGMPCAIVDVSGDIAVGAPPPGEPGWRIVVEPGAPGQAPEELVVRECAVSTSGDRLQARPMHGTRGGHLLDPVTGLPLPHLRQATVVARDATTADAVATALCTLTAERAAEVASRRTLAARIDRVDHDGGVRAFGDWARLTRAWSSQEDGSSAPEAPHPSPASPASGPRDSRALPSR